MHLHKWAEWGPPDWMESVFKGGWMVQYRKCTKCRKIKRRII